MHADIIFIIYLPEKLRGRSYSRNISLLETLSLFLLHKFQIILIYSIQDEKRPEKYI